MRWAEGPTEVVADSLARGSEGDCWARRGRSATERKEADTANEVALAMKGVVATADPSRARSNGSAGNRRRPTRRRPRRHQSPGDSTPLVSRSAVGIVHRGSRTATSTPDSRSGAWISHRTRVQRAASPAPALGASSGAGALFLVNMYSEKFCRHATVPKKCNALKICEHTHEIALALAPAARATPYDWDTDCTLYPTRFGAIRRGYDVAIPTTMCVNIPQLGSVRDQHRPAAPSRLQ